MEQNKFKQLDRVRVQVWETIFAIVVPVGLSSYVFGRRLPPPLVALLNPATLAEFSKRATIRFADFFSVSMVTTPLFRCLFSEWVPPRANQCLRGQFLCAPLTLRSASLMVDLSVIAKILRKNKYNVIHPSTTAHKPWYFWHNSNMMLLLLLYPPWQQPFGKSMSTHFIQTSCYFEWTTLLYQVWIWSPKRHFFDQNPPVGLVKLLFGISGRNLSWIFTGFLVVCHLCWPNNNGILKFWTSILWYFDWIINIITLELRQSLIFNI